MYFSLDLGKNTTEMIYASSTYITGAHDDMPYYCVVNLGYLVKMVLVKFPHYQVTILPS